MNHTIKISLPDVDQFGVSVKSCCLAFAKVVAMFSGENTELEI